MHSSITVINKQLDIIIIITGVGHVHKKRHRLSNRKGFHKAAVKLADVTVQIARLSEASLAPLARVRLFTRVHHGVPAQVVRILEALPALAARVGLLAGVRALVALQRVHAGESLAALRAGGHGTVGREFGTHPVLLPEVSAEVQLQHMRAREDFAAQRAHAHLLAADG